MTNQDTSLIINIVVFLAGIFYNVTNEGAYFTCNAAESTVFLVDRVVRRIIASAMLLGQLYIPSDLSIKGSIRMRRLLLPMAAVFLSLSLFMTTALSITPVSAQRFGAPSETIDNELNFFNTFVTEDRVQNPSFMEAYKDYQTAVALFTPHDVYFEDSVGTSLTEVQDTFEASVEGEFYTLSEDESYLSYLYEVEPDMVAELLLYFVNEEIYYIGLSNLDVTIDMEEFVPDADIQAWVDDKIPAADLANEDIRIIGISQMRYNDLVYYMMLIPTGDSEEAMNVDHTIVVNDSVYQSYWLNFDQSLEAPQDNMIQFFAYFFGVTDEYPSSNSTIIEDESTP